MCWMGRRERYKPRQGVIDEHFLSSVEPKPKNRQNITFNVKQNQISIHLSSKLIFWINLMSVLRFGTEIPFVLIL